MKRFHLKVDENGELRIPPNIVRELSEHSQTLIEVQLTDGRLMLLQSTALDTCITHKDGLLVHTGVPVGDIDSILATLRECRLSELENS